MAAKISIDPNSRTLLSPSDAAALEAFANGLGDGEVMLAISWYGQGWQGVMEYFPPGYPDQNADLWQEWDAGPASTVTELITMLFKSGGHEQ